MTETPALSVIVVSFNQLPVLRQCLAAFQSQFNRLNVEIIVIRDWKNGDDKQFKREFPQFSWIDAPAASTVPAMRKIALLQCQGKVVGFTEDDCVVCEDWCAKVIEAHKAENVAIGGSVEPSNFARSLD